ncbi:MULTISPECIES: hypothetical protein [unclassified Pseudomonas]|uniref:hypothetical protein n=1 Tax=unclassified Pseudomonas TaxID=196821 RepID=UPI0025D02565|nr:MULTISPECIES: hypothetical protein [unclassified Pseudomonas]
MQLLMVLLLALIALILAPALVWLFAAGAVAYGVVIAIGGMLTFTLMLAYVLWPLFKGWRSKRAIDSKIRQANRIFREKEEARIAAREASNTSLDDEDCDTNGARKSCSQCQMEMLMSARRCPSCGHKVGP